MHARHLMRTAAVSLALASTLLTAGGAGAAEVSGWEVSLSGDSPAGSLMSVSSVDDDLRGPSAARTATA